MTEEEKAICKKYSARDEEGLVHCRECPLVLDKTAFICKASEELIKNGWGAEGDSNETRNL